VTIDIESLLIRWYDNSVIKANLSQGKDAKLQGHYVAASCWSGIDIPLWRWL